MSQRVEVAMFKANLLFATKLQKSIVTCYVFGNHEETDASIDICQNINTNLLINLFNSLHRQIELGKKINN